MNSDDKVFYEADDGDFLAPDVEESEKPDYKETYEPEDENSLGSEDETEDEDNSKATRSDITSSERFNSHGSLTLMMMTTIKVRICTRMTATIFKMRVKVVSTVLAWTTMMVKELFRMMTVKMSVFTRMRSLKRTCRVLSESSVVWMVRWSHLCCLFVNLLPQAGKKTR